MAGGHRRIPPPLLLAWACLTVVGAGERQGVAYGLRSKSAGAPGWAGGVIRNLGAGGAGTRAAGGVMAGGLCGGEAKSVWLRLRGGGVERKGPQTDDEAAEEVARLLEECDLSLADVNHLIEQHMPPGEDGNETRAANATSDGDSDLANLKEVADLFHEHAPSVYRYARALHMRARFEEAKAMYASAASLCTGRTEWSQIRAHALCNWGLVEHAELENFTRADQLYREALSADPGHLAALCNLGRLLDGGNPQTWNTYVSTRWTNCLDPEAAEGFYRAALRVEPDHVPTLANYGYFLEYTRESHDEARAMYLRGLELEPNNTVLLRNYAGFLCNVEEPYDEDTLMPVYFNTTCNAAGNFDPFTGTPINPAVDRPVDRARAIYGRVLDLEPPGGGRDPRTGVQVPDYRYPLMHGIICKAFAPDLSVEEARPSEGDAESAAQVIRERLRRAEDAVRRAAGGGAGD